MKSTPARRLHVTSRSMSAVALLLAGLLAGAWPAAQAANFETSACWPRTCCWH